MPTYILSKKKFMEEMNKLIEDEQVVVLSNEMTGNLTISKKNGLKMSQVFAHDVFKDQGIGHIFFGRTRGYGFFVSQNEELSENSKQIIKENS